MSIKQAVIIGNCELYLGTMEETIGGIEYADHILTDPPYLYIKTHDFDREFDERLLFENARRMLPNDGFIALFGRGTSFYRWNTMLAELGFVFKEEIVWDKRFATAPAMSISRVHETISIHTVKSGKIRKCKVPYVEQKQYDKAGIINDIKRIRSAINSNAGLNNIVHFINTGLVPHGKGCSGHRINNSSGLECKDPACGTMRFIKDGMREKTIMPVFPVHYGSVHPTEKPVRLMERLINLISVENDLIFDPFMGSGTTGVACVNTGRKFIGIERDPAYFKDACKRIKEAQAQGQFDFGGGA